MRPEMQDSLPDYYRLLEVEPSATVQTIRRAFRVRVLAVHPDKAVEPTDPGQLHDLIQAFETLVDPDLRDDYDRRRRIINRSSDDEESKIPHVTESDRPVDRARAILYLLLRERRQEALERVRGIEGSVASFMQEHLEIEEFIDAAFLLGEVFERKSAFIPALQWYQQVLQSEKTRRQHRPCLSETIERVKRLLIARLGAHEDPRVALDYLRRAQDLGLDRLERIEVAKRRAQCYLELEMLDVAARHFREALQLQPQLKGARRLREALRDYL